ncbi:HAD family hydrolase [Actinocorallia aurea]
MGAALFDVDGTLTDTTYHHVLAWWEAFGQVGRRVAAADIHRAIGLPSEKLLDRLAPERDRDEDEVLLGAHGALFGAYRQRVTALAGAAELLHACKERGLTVVLATSADPRELGVLRAALDAEGALDAVDEVTSTQDVSEGKPAPDLVHRALALADASPSEAFFVGDSEWDMQAAVRAGVTPVAVLTGGIAEAALRHAGAAHVAPTLPALQEALPALLPR